MKIIDVFVKWSQTTVTVHKAAWGIAWAFALVGALVGFYMLYAGRYGAWDWILALPTVAYVACSTVNLSLFYALTVIVAWCCKTVGTDTAAEVRREIKDLDEGTRPIQ